ncbi:unnamed protein product [Clonostachys chloroleuca]|uniref:AB hydrolase-1 domain-containing protein n=1 Tax=Clonostachys chloroleuca TaxID=1926264 RepID=A0AA35MDW8_9HYPO|nr:unnamed protein product [Clonostachys chloroleuca]
MTVYSFHFQVGASRSLGTVATLATACCLSVYCLYVRPALRHENKTAATILAKTRRRSLAAGRQELEPEPYPQDVFPGGREVETPYGTIQVFEWGPENGEKVALVHGIGTPCIALGDMAKQFVAKGCRVLLFDLFGRGYSDAPGDLPYDDRLYTSQILLALASSPLSWTGTESFHLVGYSLGAALSAAFAAYFPHMLRSVTLVCPGGLIRPSHVSWRSKLIYSEGLLPTWLSHYLARWRLEPRHHGPSADVPVDVDNDADIDFDEVPLSQAHGGSGARVGDVMRWQMERNDAFVGAYISTLNNAPIYGHHEGVWKRLAERLAERRVETGRPSGLSSGKVCLVLATRDPVVVLDEWLEDSRKVLGEEGADIQILSGGHEIAITKGKEVADVAMRSWPQ